MYYTFRINQLDERPKKIQLFKQKKRVENAVRFE